jgi:hypothetical protein
VWRHWIYDFSTLHRFYFHVSNFLRQKTLTYFFYFLLQKKVKSFSPHKNESLSFESSNNKKDNQEESE